MNFPFSPSNRRFTFSFRLLAFCFGFFGSSLRQIVRCLPAAIADVTSWLLASVLPADDMHIVAAFTCKAHPPALKIMVSTQYQPYACGVHGVDQRFGMAARKMLIRIPDTCAKAGYKFRELRDVLQLCTATCKYDTAIQSFLSRSICFR